MSATGIRFNVHLANASGGHSVVQVVAENPAAARKAVEKKHGPNGLFVTKVKRDRLGEPK